MTRSGIYSLIVISTVILLGQDLYAAEPWGGPFDPFSDDPLQEGPENFPTPSDSPVRLPRRESAHLYSSPIYGCSLLRCSIVNVSDQTRTVQIIWRNPNGDSVAETRAGFPLGAKKSMEASRPCNSPIKANYCEFIIEGSAWHFRANGNDLGNPARIVPAY